MEECCLKEIGRACERYLKRKGEPQRQIGCSMGELLEAERSSGELARDTGRELQETCEREGANRDEN